ncbi:MAG TPA: hypothetical protein VGN26_01350 [Armatimonadota bacterium]|jgi:hypothetical protein
MRKELHLARALSLVLAGVALCLARPAQAQSTLGSFTFNDAQFGDTLGQSDGGTFASQNWLNVVNADPGSPAYLTGANFNTGIANIGYDGQPTYEIGYSTPIVNGAGADLGLVAARFSTDDFQLSVSTDGLSFTPFQTIDRLAAVATGVTKSYVYNHGGPYSADLFVNSIDLSGFGLSEGQSIVAVKVTSSPQGDLIRVAGFMRPVPETTTLLGFLPGLAALGLLAPRRRRTR